MTFRRGGDVLAVGGLRREARLARGAGVRALAGGGDAAGLEAAIRRELLQGVRGLASFGIAGGLAPGLRPGTLIIADAVAMPEGGLHATDARWSAALRRALPKAVAGTLAGSETIVASRQDKAALRARTGAVAVDMESQVVARVAADHRLPFVVLRAVADPAERRLPPAARIAMRAGGGVDVPAVCRSILRAPGQIAGLLGVALDARAALAALRRGRRRLGPGLGGPDLDQPPLDVV